MQTATDKLVSLLLQVSRKSGRATWLSAFLCMLCVPADGSAVCWGDSDYGGNCTGLDLAGTTAVSATQAAFAARSFSAERKW